MKRSIRSYLPKPKEIDKSEMLHVRISSNLKDKLFSIAERNSWKSSDIIRGAIQKFVDDEQKESA